MAIDLTLAHSPDADDLVMWWPLTGQRHPDGAPVEGELGEPRVDLGPFRFTLLGHDVEALNAEAAGDRDPPYDVTAISAGAYPSLAGRWRITACGGSFGEGYGPRVVVREDSPIRSAEDLRGVRVAVPGVRTSAFLTLSLLLGGDGGGGSRGFEHEAMLFSEVPGAVVDGRADAGLLIHEAQLTHGSLGLRSVVDLGAWWGERTGLPLPLGLNVVRRDLDERFGTGTVERLSRVLSASVAHAAAHRDASYQHLIRNMGGRTEWRDRAMVDRYLDMYVSGLTLDMGERGREALRRLLGEGAMRGFADDPGEIDVI